MKLNYAPIIHARTKYVDFRKGLLVLPVDFSETDAQDVHSLVLDSTRFFELAGTSGRRVVYGNGKFVVSGISIIFQELFKLCNKEPEFNRVDHENGRLAYGFVGVVFPVASRPNLFDIPNEVFLNIYLKHIKTRWEETTETENVFGSKKVEYEEIDLPDAGRIANFDTQLSNRSGKLLLEDIPEDCDATVAYVLSKALRGERIAFCSNITIPKLISESRFDIVTCRNASSILPPEVQVRPLQNQPEPADNYSLKRTAQRLPKKMHLYEPPKKKKESSLDDILEQYNAPIENKDFLSERYNPREYARKKDNKAPYMKEAKKNDNTTLSYNDIIREKSDIFTKKSDFTEIATVLGVIAGVTFTVIGLATQANPIVLATVGVITVVLTGMEAKRILDRFNS
ncbi:hypothetical protein [Anaeromicropila populeti]|uniref:Uncharacterized protein n=1 Tax=Anaeromicropila populeti TaxID=37658 RepID=A0A1I6KLQ3_9FIRM|nr:hypothetical protein [Anaeromicropila populeti]SFR92131.1 hypothetical protein SAMN05661086_02519 [Anaeromicropila populeti]